MLRLSDQSSLFDIPSSVAYFNTATNAPHLHIRPEDVDRLLEALTRYLESQR